MKKSTKAIITIAVTLSIGSSTASFMIGGFAKDTEKNRQHIEHVKSEVKGVIMTKEQYEEEEKESAENGVNR